MGEGGVSMGVSFLLVPPLTFSHTLSFSRRVCVCVPRGDRNRCNDESLFSCLCVFADRWLKGGEGAPKQRHSAEPPLWPLTSEKGGVVQSDRARTGGGADGRRRGGGGAAQRNRRELRELTNGSGRPLGGFG